MYEYEELDEDGEGVARISVAHRPGHAGKHRPVRRMASQGRRDPSTSFASQSSRGSRDAGADQADDEESSGGRASSVPEEEEEQQLEIEEEEDLMDALFSSPNRASHSPHNGGGHLRPTASFSLQARPTPSLSTPSFSTPSLSTPFLSTPSLSTPSFSTPSFSTPSLLPILLTAGWRHRHECHCYPAAPGRRRLVIGGAASVPCRVGA